MEACEPITIPRALFIEKIFFSPDPPVKSRSWGGEAELELRKRKYFRKFRKGQEGEQKR